MPKKLISLRVDERVLDAIDKARGSMTRSAWICHVLDGHAGDLVDLASGVTPILSAYPVSPHLALANDSLSAQAKAGVLPVERHGKKTR